MCSLTLLAVSSPFGAQAERGAFMAQTPDGALLAAHLREETAELLALLPAARRAAAGGPGSGEAALDGIARAAYRTLRTAENLAAHAALGTAFHETILERASNPLLISIARSSCRVISKYLMFQQWRTLYTTEELFQRHNSMYEAFLTRNPYAIEEAVRAHYADSAERLAQICEAEQKPKAPRSRRAHFPTE